MDRVADVMTLKQQVVRILRGSTASRIRFTFPSGGRTISISAGSFNQVARALESGRAFVAPPAALIPGAAAQYTGFSGGSVPANTMEVPRILGRIEEGHILHESLHCAYDLLGTNITAVDDEASCYVVSALAFLMSGVRPARWSNDPFASAGRVARGLLARYQRGERGAHPVDPANWQVLRAVIMMNPIYMFPGSASNDWTLGPVITGGSYTHDG